MGNSNYYIMKLKLHKTKTKTSSRINNHIVFNYRQSLGYRNFKKLLIGVLEFLNFEYFLKDYQKYKFTL